jgi:hypothetical protein
MQAIIPLGSRLLATSSDLPERSHREPRRAWFPRLVLLDLAPDGVCRATRVTPRPGGLLPHRFTLTGPRKQPSGLLSVALSLTFRPVDVIDHLALRSPDFPLALCGHPQRQRLPDLPLERKYINAFNRRPWISNPKTHPSGRTTASERNRFWHIPPQAVARVASEWKSGSIADQPAATSE